MTTEVWDEVALIGIQGEDDSAEVQWAARTEDITGLELGEKAIEGRPTLSGGRIVKKTQQADGTLTLKMFPVGVDSKTSGVSGYLAGTAGSSDPYTVLNTHSWKKNRIILLWASTLPATAGAAVGAGVEAYRLTVINAYCTNVTIDYTDKHKTAEVTFTWTPFNKDGDSNVSEEYSAAGGTGIGAAAATANDKNGQW